VCSASHGGRSAAGVGGAPLIRTGLTGRGTAWKEVLAGTFDADGEVPASPDGGLNTVTSGDLHRWGAVNRLVADADVDQTAAGLAGRLTAGPTYGQARRLYRRSLVSDMATAFAEESAALAKLSATSDRVEGVAALFEGRRPKFTGR